MLADTPSDILSWKSLALAALASLLTYGASWLTPLFTRKKTSAEAERLEEETRTLALENDLKSGDAVVNYIARFIAATDRAERLRMERDHWESRAKDFENKYLLLVTEHDIVQKQLDEHVRIGNAKNTIITLNKGDKPK